MIIPKIIYKLPVITVLPVLIRKVYAEKGCAVGVYDTATITVSARRLLLWTSKPTVPILLLILITILRPI